MTINYILVRCHASLIEKNVRNLPLAFSVVVHEAAETVVALFSSGTTKFSNLQFQWGIIKVVVLIKQFFHKKTSVTLVICNLNKKHPR